MFAILPFVSRGVNLWAGGEYIWRMDEGEREGGWEGEIERVCGQSMPRRDRLARNLQRLKGSPALLKKTEYLLEAGARASMGSITGMYLKIWVFKFYIYIYNIILIIYK